MVDHRGSVCRVWNHRWGAVLRHAVFLRLFRERVRLDAVADHLWFSARRCSDSLGWSRTGASVQRAAHDSDWHLPDVSLVFGFWADVGVARLLLFSVDGVPGRQYFLRADSLPGDAVGVVRQGTRAGDGGGLP